MSLISKNLSLKKTGGRFILIVYFLFTSCVLLQLIEILCIIAYVLLTNRKKSGSDVDEFLYSCVTKVKIKRISQE